MSDPTRTHVVSDAFVESMWRLMGEDCGAFSDEQFRAREAALLAAVAEVRLLRDAVSGVVNEGWVDVERCESKMGPEVHAAILRALDE